ncbi:MAG: hypothetical protein WCQ72_05410 [Eubacteriales bacterium]
MKTVYIVFSRTNTSIGKFIRFMTGGVYNHTSFSFEPSLCDMYSVSRYRCDVPLAGGFVVEHPARYAFGTDYNRVRVKIAALEISDERYEALHGRIDRYLDGGSDILYNTIGAVTSYLGHDLILRDTYTCVEFVSEAIGAGRLSSIAALERALRPYVIYSGRLAVWLAMRRCAELIYPQYDSDFFAHVRRSEVVTSTAGHFGALLRRFAGLE